MDLKQVVLVASVFTLFILITDGQSPLNVQLTRIGNKDYFVNDLFRTNWFLADHFCRRLGMQLLTINNAQEYDSIVNYIRHNNAINGSGDTNNVWTSGTDFGREGQFVWMSTGQPVTYTRWAPNMPDNAFGGQECIALQAHNGYEYNDAKYSFENYFICEEVAYRPCTPADNQNNQNCCRKCC